MPSVLVHCAVCGDVAYNRARDGDAPWAHAPAGVVCSPRCQLRSELAYAVDGPARAEVLRRVLLESPEGSAPDVVWVAAEGRYDGVSRAVGTVVAVDDVSIVLEGEGLGPTSTALIGWDRVVDAGEVTGDE